MPELKFSLTEAQRAAFKKAAELAYMPLSVWARSNLGRVAQDASTSQPASASRKVDARTQAKYAELVKNVAERGRTVPQWYEGQLRDKLLSASDRAHADKMLELFNAKREVTP